jgi:uncharacterized protein
LLVAVFNQSLEDYQGGRDFDALKAFADSLKPLCSPGARDLCDEDQLKKIDEYTALGKDALEALIENGNKQVEEAEQTFKDEVAKLQSAYEQLMKDKDDAIAAVKASGVGMAKSVLATL